MPQSPDVLVHHNNHVRFIVPAQEGRLRSFVKRAKRNGVIIGHKGWLFADHCGDSTRTIFTAGDWEDSEELISLLISRGFKVEHKSGSVPMSNRLFVCHSADDLAHVRTGKTDYFLFLSAVMAGV